ncbi:transposase, partial [Paracandidimonas lactea]|uniref:transposase n=1 Tax=Paracandidimonas lactea TaxID=2895524 RepID=UPI001F4126A1
DNLQHRLRNLFYFNPTASAISGSIQSSQSDCTTCPQKGQCCPNTPTRKIARSIHEAERNVARAIAATPEYQQSRCDRKKVEMLFAHLKRILKLDRLRLRGLSGAQDEFLLAATAQNLRRMAKWLMPCVQKAQEIPV